MADILKFDNTKFIENMVQQKPLYNTSGNVNCYKHFGKKKLELSYKVEHLKPLQPSNSNPSYKP